MDDEYSTFKLCVLSNGPLRCNSFEKGNVIEYKYLAWLLLQEGKRARFSRSYRASIDRVSQIKITVPPYEIQKEVVAQVDALEQQIAELEFKLISIDKAKQNIISKYLN